MGTVSKPFPIPKFRSETDDNLREKVLTDKGCKDMVQTLATILMTYDQRPSLAQCGVVARSLVETYTFLRDDEGDGDVGEICYL